MLHTMCIFLTLLSNVITVTDCSIFFILIVFTDIFCLFILMLLNFFVATVWCLHSGDKVYCFFISKAQTLEEEKILAIYARLQIIILFVNRSSRD
jgi:hypothetical protein